MAEAYLTNTQCDRATEIANEINNIPGKIKTSVETFEAAINSPTVNAWVSDTEVGAKIKSVIESNNEAFKVLADQITGVYQTTMQLVINSRKNNNSN